MFANIAYALLGAIFGAILTLSPFLWSRAQQRLRAMRKLRWQTLMATGAVDRWLIKYYESRGVSLFYCVVGGSSSYVSFIANEAWIFTKRVAASSEWLIDILPERVTPFPVDDRLLERRRRMGAVLFQSWRKSLNLDSMQILPHAKILARPCEYFEIASALISLEDETYNNIVRHQRRRKIGSSKTPLRDRHMSDFPITGKGLAWPFSLGCHAVIAIKSGEEFELAVQTRGETVITYPNMKAMIPNFGFEPNEYWSGKSAYGCIFYNFVREYLEELFNYEEIIGRTTWSQDPDFLFELPEARTLMNAYNAGRFRLTFLGAGVECLSGTFTMALVALISDPEVIEQLRRNLTPNYEVATPTTARTPIEFLKVSDPRLGYWLEEGHFQPSSAFALSLALKHLGEEPA